MRKYPPTYVIDDGDNLDRLHVAVTPHTTSQQNNPCSEKTTRMPSKTKENYLHLESTLTHKKIVEAGYATYDGPDGFRRFLSDKDQPLTLNQLKAKSNYGTAPAYHKFGGSRLAPVYWKKSEIAHWLNQRYGHTEDRILVKKAEKAGFVIEVLPDVPKEIRPKAKSRRAGDPRKKASQPPVTLPVHKWAAPKGTK